MLIFTATLLTFYINRYLFLGRYCLYPKVMKLNRILMLLLAVVTCFTVAAQSGAHISGRVVDGDTLEGVAGAVIEVNSVKTPSQKRYYTTEYGGNFRIPNVAQGDYDAVVTFIGYADKRFSFRSEGLPKSIGDVTITVSAIGDYNGSYRYIGCH